MMKRRKIQKFIGLVCGIVIMLCPTTLFAEPTEESNVKDKNRTYYSDVYCAGHDDDFSKQENIDSDDYNYGWKLGEFCVSGYSSHVTDGEGNYVFLKNAGDKITLSFILEQKDIHCLDGKSELYIRELSSRDEYFQTQKLDFGHGAMILRYTDSENKKHDPEIYTNYLETLEVGNENMISVEGPDTTSYLLEEGDYEVALDYRVAKEKNGPLFINPKDKYQDYRIFFKFSIRNGNCMSFMYHLHCSQIQVPLKELNRPYMCSQLSSQLALQTNSVLLFSLHFQIILICRFLFSVLKSLHYHLSVLILVQFVL